MYRDLSTSNRVHGQLCQESVSCRRNSEVGLALKSHLLAPRSEPAASVVNFVLRHSGLERGEISKDILPFPLSFCPTAAEISLSLEAGRAQLGQAEEAEAALDDYIQKAGLEVWTFLVTWACFILSRVRWTSPTLQLFACWSVRPRFPPEVPCSS